MKKKTVICPHVVRSVYPRGLRCFATNPPYKAEFDMTRTRVKQTETNPYVDGGTRPMKFENALNKQGDKRAPTEDELNWFNSITF